jgi:hypothetical protein
LPFLPLDDLGKRAAARTIAKHARDGEPYTGNEWVAAMYSSLRQVRDVIIDRTVPDVQIEPRQPQGRMVGADRNG